MIRVHVRKKPGRFLQMFYVDKLTGKDVCRSTGTHDLKEARLKAAAWQVDLEAGKPDKNDISWEVFIRRFTDEHLVHLAKSTRDTYRSAFNRLEEHIGKPKRLADITSQHISELAASMANAGSPKTTIHNVLRHIKGAMSWAVQVELLGVKPRFKMPSMRGVKMMHGRPISDKEFQQLLDATDQTAPTIAKELKFLFRGIWESGLRIDEVRKVYWDKGPIRLDFTGAKYPRFLFDSTAHKAGTPAIVPMTPEFIAHMQTVPITQRKGRAFIRITRAIRDAISQIGAASGVIVNDEGKGVTCHDLRRSFLTRWSYRVRPVVLRVLARHANIDTTLKFYVDQNADDTGKVIHESVPLAVPRKGQTYTKAKKTTPKKARKK